MNNKILKKYAEKDKEYLEFLSANKPSDFPKEIAVKIEPIWNDIYDYENGGFLKRLKLKSNPLYIIATETSMFRTM